MSVILQQHISRFIRIDPADFGSILSYFTPINVPKKYNLLQEGQICQHHYFVLNGCLRLFYITEKGTEQTIDFAMENWWMADYQSYATRQSAGFFIQSVLPSHLLALGYSAQEELLEKFPGMEKYFRLIHQRAHAAAQYRMRIMQELSGEELYRRFEEAYPAFVQRVPQYLLASFLGFTPEYLSEIRSRKRS
ncbi:MAG TPA: Crp/Fnr family transcriptional regulator [Sediminibacterium sp.]|nr:Crp/Fnr family transcriptional regulator [Sediminibacterium sp.]